MFQSFFLPSHCWVERHFSFIWIKICKNSLLSFSHEPINLDYDIYCINCFKNFKQCQSWFFLFCFVSWEVGFKSWINKKRNKIQNVQSGLPASAVHIGIMLGFACGKIKRAYSSSRSDYFFPPWPCSIISFHTTQWPS